MKKITLWLFALFFSMQVNSQVNAYSFAQSSGTYTSLSGPTVIAAATTANNFDSQNWAIANGTIPFNFNFNGIDYTGCNVNSNGYITFGATLPTASTSTPISNATAYSGAISAWGGDLNAGFISGLITSQVSYGVEGTAPNREFVIEYSNWRPAYSTSTTIFPFINFQIRLVETSNQIKVVYGNTGVAIGTATTAGTRQIGLRGATNADFNNRLNAATLNFNSSTAGIANNSSQAYSYATGATQGLPSNGLVYTWTPPTCIAPTGLNITNLTTTSATANWNANANASLGYEYELSTTNTAPTASGTVTTSTSASFTTLNPSTTYYLWIRSNCDAGGLSTWNVISFFTGYCVPSSTSTATYFDNFSTNGSITNITNNASGFATGGYQNNYSSATVTSFASGTVNYSLSIVGGTAGVAMWIDWNNNLVFEASEVVYSSNSYLATGNHTGSFAIPSTVALGDYRMRIRTDFNSINPDPCAVSFNRTEAEDYKITITSAPNDAMDFNNIQWVTDGTNGSNSSLSVPVNTPLTAYAEGYESGVTEAAGVGAGVEAWIGSSTTNTDPATWPSSAWLPATYVDNAGNNDNFSSTLNLPVGTHYVASRWRLNSAAFTYGGYNGTWNGTTNNSIQVNIQPLANDNCSGAIGLTVGNNFASNSVSASILGATTTPGITPSCQTLFGSDLWYSVVVPASGNVTIESQVATSNSMTDSVISVFSGACGTLTQIACDDDSGLAGANNLMSVVNITGRTPGEVLYVAIWKYAVAAPTATTSSFQISAFDCPSTTLAPTGDATQSFCVAATVQDLVATGTGIKWYDAATGGNLLTATTALVSGNSYFASQTINCEGLARFEVVVTLDAQIVPTFDAIPNLCVNSTAPTLPTTSNNSIIGTWSPSTIDTTVAGTFTYTFTPNAGQCASNRVIDIVISDLPTAPTGDAAQTFCSTTSPTLASLTVSGTGLIWYDAATGGNVLPNTTVLTATTYYVASNNGTCESSRLQIVVTEDCPFTGCLTVENGQWPTGAFTPNATLCDGVTIQNITTCGYASEFSVVNVTLGQTYTFASSVSTDVITLSTDDGATAITTGVGSVVWLATVTGPVRFYTHLDGCLEEDECRIKTVICGVPSTDQPDYVSLQWPPTITITQGGSGTVYGQVYEAGLTDVVPNIDGQAAGIEAWIGISPVGSNTNPNTWTNWIPATWNPTHISNNDEYQATVGAALLPGTYYYATRFRLNFGPYVYGGIDSSNNGAFWNGTTYNSGILTVTPPPAPANDECTNAIALTPGGVFADNPLSGTILGASTTAGVTPSCQTLFAADVWYSVVVPASGSITIETQVASSNTVTDSVIAAFSGACGTLTQLGCDDDGGPAGANNLMSILSLSALTPGDVIYVGVWKYGTAAPTGTNSQFQVSAYDPSLATDTFDASSFKFYPNPVKDMLNLSYSQNISKVQVINLLGQEVTSKSIDATDAKVDMSNLPSGTYLVKVTSDNQVKTIKVIKQ
jgi:hypothetical protein